MYLDSAYIAKYYVNEPDSIRVRDLVDRASVCSSWFAFVEVICAFHRHLRDGSLTAAQVRTLRALFVSHVEAGMIALYPVTDAVLKRTATRVGELPENVYLRSGDAIHLGTALEIGEREVWTSDRHMLAAAPHFGLVGRSV